MAKFIVSVRTEGKTVGDVSRRVPFFLAAIAGRARSSIANLYRWRYKKLGDLSHVNQLAEYQAANAGFRFDFQVVDVGDFNNVGESEPNPYFYQVSIILSYHRGRVTVCQVSY